MIESKRLKAFQRNLRGGLIQPGDPVYDEARAVFNAMVDRRPALIVRCKVASDVIVAVEFAGEHDLSVAVRGGGHSVSGNAVCDGGLVIDLSQMNGVQVDPATRRARVEGGATWGDFDHAAQAFGLATTGGIVPTTGVAGLTLGGGLGYLNRKHGLACDNLLSAEVVTADARLLTASAEENEELFWGLRGGGGNFGVVTSLEYTVHPVGPVLGGEIVFPLDHAEEVLRFYRDWSTAAPDEMRADATLLSGPEGAGLAIIVCYAGPIDEGEKLVQPLRAFGPMLDTVAQVPYTAVQNLLTDVLAPGFLHYWKSGFVQGFGDDGIATIVDFFAADVPSPIAAVAIEHLGGAVSRVAVEDTAFRRRRAQHSLLVLRAWRDPEQSEENIAWARRCYTAARSLVEDGAYVNYLGDEGASKVRAAYGANYNRLVALKATLDPRNVFRFNQNIKPSTSRR